MMPPTGKAPNARQTILQLLINGSVLNISLMYKLENVQVFPEPSWAYITTVPCFLHAQLLAECLVFNVHSPYKAEN